MAEKKTLSIPKKMGEDLAHLLGVSVNMVQKTELTSLLKFIMNEAARILDAERCTLYLVDEEARELKSFIIQPQLAELKEISLSMGKGIAGHVARTAEVVNLEDAYQSPLFDSKTDKETGYKTRTVLCVSMKDKNNKVIGVLQALNKKKGTFNTHDEWLFKSYATCAANSISAITGGEKATPDAKSRENLERLSLTVENIPDGVIMLLKEEDSVVVNPAARWMLGLEINKIIDRKGTEEHLREIGLGNVLKWNEVGKLSSQEVTLQEPKERVIKVDFAEIDGDAGLKKGLVIVLRDITKEKEMDRIKSEFIAIASHEFLSPLTSMKSALSLFLQGMLGPLTDNQKRFLNIMRDSVEYLSYLATTLLDVSLIESKKMRLKQEKVDLGEVVRSSIESVRSQAEKKGISLLSNDGNIPPVLADPYRVRQAVLALLDNALKFSPQRGKVVVSIKPAGKEVEVSVEDNGIGIPLEEQEKIFEKFYQVESAITREHYGLGLGLSICKDIIEAQGGRIWVESKVGEGSRFAFTLPLYT